MPQASGLQGGQLVERRPEDHAAGDVLAAVVPAEEPEAQPSPPSSVPGPMSIPSMRSVVTAQQTPAIATRKTAGHAAEALTGASKARSIRTTCPPCSVISAPR